MKDRRLNSVSDSRPIIGCDFGANITSQYRPTIIIQASIDHRFNIDSQHCELGPIIGPIIFSYMGSTSIVFSLWSQVTIIFNNYVYVYASFVDESVHTRTPVITCVNVRIEEMGSPKEEDGTLLSQRVRKETEIHGKRGEEKSWFRRENDTSSSQTTYARTEPTSACQEDGLSRAMYQRLWVSPATR